MQKAKRTLFIGRTVHRINYSHFNSALYLISLDLIPAPQTASDQCSSSRLQATQKLTLGQLLLSIHLFELPPSHASLESEHAAMIEQSSKDNIFTAICKSLRALHGRSHHCQDLRGPQPLRNRLRGSCPRHQRQILRNQGARTERV